MSNTQTQIQPIDYFIFAGFQKRFQQEFLCRCAFINQNDKTRILERIFGEGNPLTYPYAYFELQTISANDESYNANDFARRGLVINANTDSTFQTARILPANFEIDITFITNKFMGVEPGSVMSFTRKWLFARRFGYLKFSIDYGLQNINIGVTNGESISIPQRENVTESETKYELKVNSKIHGYVSEPVLGIKGNAQKINLTEQVAPTKPLNVISETFHPFNR
jgi:hypothetical protein